MDKHNLGCNNKNTKQYTKISQRKDKGIHHVNDKVTSNAYTTSNLKAAGRKRIFNGKKKKHKLINSPKREASLNAAARLNIHYADGSSISVEGSPTKDRSPTKSLKQRKPSLPLSTNVTRSLFGNNHTLYSTQHNCCVKKVQKETCQRKRKKSVQTTEVVSPKFARRLASLNAEAIISATNTQRSIKNRDTVGRLNSARMGAVYQATVDSDSSGSGSTTDDQNTSMNNDLVVASCAIDSSVVDYNNSTRDVGPLHFSSHQSIVVTATVSLANNPISLSMSSTLSDCIGETMQSYTTAQSRPLTFNTMSHSQPTLPVNDLAPPPYTYHAPSNYPRFSSTPLGAITPPFNYICHQHCNPTVPLACNRMCPRVCTSGCASTIQHFQHDSAPVYGFLSDRAGYFPSATPMIPTLPDHGMVVPPCQTPLFYPQTEVKVLIRTPRVEHPFIASPLPTTPSIFTNTEQPQNSERKSQNSQSILTASANVAKSDGEKLVQRACYPSIMHTDGEVINVRDAVLLCSGPKNSDIPYVAKIAAFYEDPISGDIMMSLLWYYRPEHTDMGRQSYDLDQEVFASKHRDENSVECIEDKCFILTYNQYCRFMAEVTLYTGDTAVTKKVVPPVPRCETELPPSNTDPDRVFLCRKVYDFRQKRLLKNPY